MPKRPASVNATQPYDVIMRGEQPSRMRVSVVRFAPGARNGWHSHAVGQTLHVIEGHGLVQSRGGTVVEIGPGDTIYTPPGEWHWHAAAPDSFMTHLAMWEAPDDGPKPGGATSSPTTSTTSGRHLPATGSHGDARGLDGSSRQAARRSRDEAEPAPAPAMYPAPVSRSLGHCPEIRVAVLDSISSGCRMSERAAPAGEGPPLDA
jgi:quercetin dioxygenase-like cupin family protein